MLEEEGETIKEFQRVMEQVIGRARFQEFTSKQRSVSDVKP